MLPPLNWANNEKRQLVQKELLESSVYWTKTWSSLIIEEVHRSYKLRVVGRRLKLSTLFNFWVSLEGVFWSTHLRPWSCSGLRVGRIWEISRVQEGWRECVVGPGSKFFYQEHKCAVSEWLESLIKWTQGDLSSFSLCRMLFVFFFNMWFWWGS